MEFQAIVLAGGRGNRMNELTKNEKKCLLRIGNKPMVWYSVRLLEKSGFNDIFIVTQNSIKNEVESQLYDNGIRCRLHMIGFDDNEDEDDDYDEKGTAHALYLLKDRIVNDCIIVSCDLITNVNLVQMANVYRANNAAFLMLLYDIPEQNFELPVPGTKGKYSPELDYIGFDESSNRLLFFGAKEDNESDINLKPEILRKYPVVTLSSRIQDAHLYFMKKYLIDYIIEHREQIISIKGDFLPHICKEQFMKIKKRKRDYHNNDLSVKQSQVKKHIFDYAPSSLLEKSHCDPLSCYVYLQTDGICLRTNNLAIYAEANRQAMTKIYPLFKRERNESVSKYDKTQVGNDSIIGDSSKIGDKAMVKKSVIGKNCIIGDKAKVINSVLFDNVEIAENSIIQGSILCSKVKLTQKCEIKDSIIEHNQAITVASKINNETISDVDNLMEI